MSLSEVCYARIHENIYFGLFGGLKLIIDKNTGYFNATQLCRDGGKKFKNWIRNKEAGALVEYVQRIRNLPAFYIVNNGPSEQCDIIRGTYVPKELILAVASWISPEFYLMCSDIVNDVLIKDFKLRCYEFERNNKLLQTCLKEAEDKMHQLKTSNQQLLQGCVKPVRNKAVHNMFAIIEKNIDENCISSIADTYPYTTVRIQKRGYTKAIEDLKGKYQNARVISTMAYNPNSVNLFNHIKEKISYVKTRYNDFRLENVSIGEFIQDINKIIAA